MVCYPSTAGHSPILGPFKRRALSRGPSEQRPYAGRGHHELRRVLRPDRENGAAAEVEGVASDRAEDARPAARRLLRARIGCPDWSAVDGSVIDTVACALVSQMMMLSKS